MAVKKVARIGDTVRGHFDVLGNEILGTITSGSSDTKNGGTGLARNNDIISIPSHPHQIVMGNPTNYHSHSWRIVGTSKNTCNAEKLALDGDGGNDADWDGFQQKPSEMYIEASTTNLNSA